MQPTHEVGRFHNLRSWFYNLIQWLQKWQDKLDWLYTLMYITVCVVSAFAVVMYFRLGG
jgi:hypothetical protein